MRRATQRKMEKGEDVRGDNVELREGVSAALDAKDTADTRLCDTASTRRAREGHAFDTVKWEGQDKRQRAALTASARGAREGSAFDGVK